METERDKSGSNVLSRERSIKMFEMPDECKHKRTYDKPNQLVKLLFRCPEIEEGKALTRTEWSAKIRKFTTKLKERNPTHAAIIEIKSLNHRKLIEECMDALEFYLKMIIEPEDVKREDAIDMKSNPFRDKISPIEGALDFILSLGFEKIVKDNKPTLIYREYLYPKEDLSLALFMLRELKGFELVLERDCKVFTKPYILSDLFLPHDFFYTRPEDLAIEWRLRTFQAETPQGISTRNLYRYCREKKEALYTRIEVRLPRGHSVHGTFVENETLRDVREFLSEVLVMKRKFRFVSTELYIERDAESKTLNQLRLVPFGTVNVLFEEIRSVQEQPEEIY